MDEDAVKVDEGRREATLQVTNLAVEDYFTLANSLSDGALKPPVNATASFRAEWSGGGQAITIGDGLFQATVIEDTASIRWSAHEDGFAFFSDESTTSVFAVLGRERNGRFL